MRLKALKVAGEQNPSDPCTKNVTEAIHSKNAAQCVWRGIHRACEEVCDGKQYDNATTRSEDDKISRATVQHFTVSLSKLKRGVTAVELTRKLAWNS